MQERIPQAIIYKTQPAIAKALISLGQAAIESGLEMSLIHLMKLRASQINGCAFCQHMHADEARKDNESQTRLDVLAAWREVPIFTDRERAALHWTETLTLVANKGVNDEDYALVSAIFSTTEIINLTAVIVAINGWNRIAIGFHLLPNIN